jgi:hypothetical protein
MAPSVRPTPKPRPDGQRRARDRCGPNGIVWVGTGQGVIRFDGDSWKSYPSPVARHDLAVAASGEVWATTAGGVGRYLRAEDGWITYAEDHGLPSSGAQVIAAGPDGEVWACLVWEGVYRFDGAGWQKVEGAGTPVSDMAFATDGTIWMNGWEGTQDSFYVARFDGETWTTFEGADAFPHGFSVDAVTPDGFLWGMTPEGRLASFDSRSWRDGNSWAFYDTPASLSLHNITLLSVPRDEALWLAADSTVVRLDRGSTPDEAWTLYTQGDGLPDGYYQAMTFGPDGEIWLGTTRFQPGGAEANAERSTAAPLIVETALPLGALESPGQPIPYCRPSEAFADLSVPTTDLEVGQFLTVAVRLVNGFESGVKLGTSRYSLSVQPSILASGNLEAAGHGTSIEPGDCDQADFVLRAAAPGKLVLTGLASYEMHAMGYSWGSWSGCQSHPLEITIVP